MQPVSPPRIPDELAPLVVAPADVLDEPAFSDVSITGAQLGKTHAQALALAHVRLSKVDLAESRLPRLDASDAVFADCNLSNVRTDDFTFRRVVFAQNKLTGLHLIGGSFAHVTFSGSLMDFTRFDGAKLKNVRFERCQLRDADFVNTSFEDVSFFECDLTRATFDRMRIKTSDMRSCTLTGLRGLVSLRGITMDWSAVQEHAELFASELGILIG